MSTQSRGFPVHNVPDNIGYRLLELPPDLLALLESKEPPILTIESNEPSALLKAKGKTYTLRQKNTSNALILLTPHFPTESDPSQPSQLGLAAVTTVHETVELDVVPQVGTAAPEKPVTGRGKWHERFGKNR